MGHCLQAIDNDDRFAMRMPRNDEERTREAAQWAKGRDPCDKRYACFSKTISAADGTIVPNRWTDKGFNIHRFRSRKVCLDVNPAQFAPEPLQSAGHCGSKRHRVL